MGRTEQFLRSETPWAPIHLLPLATVYTLWPIVTAPGRRTIKVYLEWARGEEDSILHTTGGTSHRRLGVVCTNWFSKARSFPPLSIHGS